jgi:hypothetical protein
MIFDNPPHKLLRAADFVSLFDPNVPGWHVVLVSNEVDALTTHDLVERNPFAFRLMRLILIPSGDGLRLR